MFGKYIALCPNPHRDKDLAVTKRAKELLEKEGHEVAIAPLFTDEPVGELIRGASLLVSFGGDGTILHTARAATGTYIPIIGVNLGSKGFLAELETDELDKLLAVAGGKYLAERRMMLDVELVRDGRVIYSDTALNDASINGVVTTIRISAFGDGRNIITFAGDGIIAATPTGSTAYSMSAGGPLVEPSAQNIILTPVCAHYLAARAFVLAPDRQVIIKSGDLTGKRAILSVDGACSIELETGDILKARRSRHDTLIARAGSKSFYETAFEKLSSR